MLLLLLSHFSRVQLYATQWTAAHQAPPSLGFSRQEHWSGLPFPSPMHESEMGKWSQSLSPVWLLVTPWTAAYQAPLSMGFSRQEYWSGVPLPSSKHFIMCCNLTKLLWAPDSDYHPPLQHLLLSISAAPWLLKQITYLPLPLHFRCILLALCVCVCVCAKLVQSCPVVCELDYGL